jgi:cobalt-zinc-cadmium efflux system outer membrane protein
MTRPTTLQRVVRQLWRAGFTGALTVLTWAAAPSAVVAQGPQFDVGNPPGSPIARGKLGAALGASGTSGFDATSIAPQQSIFGGRPGPSVTRTPINQLGQPRPPVFSISSITPPRSLESASVPVYGQLDLPDVEEQEGPPNGVTLDQAIETVVHNNLTLLALKYEVPMAQADVLTASLRQNPIFYADGQLLPYGHYSFARPGGPQQYDVNVTIPLDVWRKRQAHMQVAARAKRVTEAQLQDAIRTQIDNLYTAYVDVVAAGLTLRFSEKYEKGIQLIMGLTKQLVDRGQGKPSDVLAVKAQLEQAELQIREAKQAEAKTLRTLGLLLNLSPSEADQVKLRSLVNNTAPLPTNPDELLQLGLQARPDLNASRFGLDRARADVRSAQAERYSDVYVLAQPYTFQNNTYLGLKSPTSWAVGVTVALPVFNRNQGNVVRTKLNADQSKIELMSQERQVVYDVSEAVREFELSRLAVIDTKNQILPASKVVRDTAYRRWQGGETTLLEFLDAQKDYNETVRSYRDALVRHRRAMLDLNTAVGIRIVP